MMQHVRLHVVGGYSTIEARRWPCRNEIRQEAQRRLNAAGYSRHRAKSLATGTAIPESIRHFAMQINYVAEALALLKPIPDDFQSDIYWPVMEAQA